MEASGKAAGGYRRGAGRAGGYPADVVAGSPASSSSRAGAARCPPAPEPPRRDRDVGVYLHVPFCERICPYCDFAVVAARSLALAHEERYVAALLRELEVRRPAFAGLGLASIYLGGGTPSLLRPASVARLVDAVRRAFAPLPAERGGDGGGDRGPEITLEVNPSTVERERLPGFRAAGVNRLSLGLQSLDDGVLKRLGRAHRAGEGRATLRAAREAGFANLSVDVIYGVPGQDPERFARDLDEVASFRPEHVSAYELTLEPGTPYTRAVDRGRLRLPPEDALLRMHEAIPEHLGRVGLVPYEISSLARPGRESVHNRRYWERRPVLGLGMGAWSTEPRSPRAPHGARRSNVRELATYLERVETGGSPAAGPPEVLGPATARAEAVFLALRTREGLGARAFAAEFGAPPRRFFPDALEGLLRAGLLRESPAGDLRLTPRGRLLADAVSAEFLP